MAAGFNRSGVGRNGEQSRLVRSTIKRGKHRTDFQIEYDTTIFNILYDTSHRLSHGIRSSYARFQGKYVIHKRYNKYGTNRYFGDGVVRRCLDYVDYVNFAVRHHH